MKITDVRTILLTGPSTNDPFLREARKLRSAAFIEIHTDTGLAGIGETYAGNYCPEAVPAIVEFFKPILIDQTLENIPELWRRMYRCGDFWGRVGLGVIVTPHISGSSLSPNFKQRLWDIFLTNLDRFIAGEPLLNELTAMQLNGE